MWNKHLYNFHTISLQWIYISLFVYHSDNLSKSTSFSSTTIEAFDPISLSPTAESLDHSVEWVQTQVIWSIFHDFLNKQSKSSPHLSLRSINLHWEIWFPILIVIFIVVFVIICVKFRRNRDRPARERVQAMTSIEDQQEFGIPAQENIYESIVWPHLFFLSHKIWFSIDLIFQLFLILAPIKELIICFRQKKYFEDSSISSR